MPYSGIDDPDLPSNVKKMSDSDKKQWVATFNSCMKDGGTDAECMKLANGVVKEESILSRLKNKLREILGIPEERSLSGSDLYNQIYAQSMSLDTWAWLIDLYFEGSDIFAILAEEGKLYKAAVTLDTGKNSAYLAERATWTEVMQEFVEVPQQKSTFMIKRMADGQDRWFLLAGTTILNRNGQIDSSKLFDGMIAKCQSSEYAYPYLTYYHLKEAFKMGMSDFLARDGVVLIASGLFDDNKVAEAMKQRYAEDPDVWGSSISFMAEPPNKEEVAQGISVDVFDEGYLTEISILKEEDACAVMTALRSTKEVNRMNEKLMKVLKALAGGDEELTNEFVGLVDTANATAKDQNLISRQTASPDATTPAEGEAAPTEGEATTPPEEPPAEPVALDEETIEQIAAVVAKSPKLEALNQEVKEALEKMAQTVTDLQKEVSDLHAVNIQATKKVEAELAELKKTDEEKQKALLEDQSSKRINARRFVYRPTIQPTTDEVLDYSAVAAETAKNLK
jgi:hypothetical protein